MTMTGQPMGGMLPGAPRHMGTSPDPGPALAMLVFGVPMLIMAGFLASDEIATMRGSVTLQGRVARISTVPGHSRTGERMPSRDLHAPVLAFRMPDGRAMEVVSRAYASTPCCAVGDAVTVRFPAGAPERAMILRLWDAWLWPALLGSVGIALVASALVTWRIARRRHAAAVLGPPGPGPVRRG